MTENSRLSSMTGFGRSVLETSSGRITVEIRSLNHRYLEVGCRVPRDLLWIESPVRSRVRKRMTRGKVEVFISVDDPAAEVKLDLDKALTIAGMLKPLADHLEDKVRLEHVLAIGDISGGFRRDEDEDLKGFLLQALDTALDGIVAHRLAEGARMADDISGRLRLLRDFHGLLEPMGKEVAIRGRDLMMKHLSELDLNGMVDDQRLEAEVAILAQKGDITEELTRLNAHLDEMESVINQGGPAGRKMDFLIQELNREINTIGSKAQLGGVSGTVVEFKAELERIREQVQNIE